MTKASRQALQKGQHDTLCFSEHAIYKVSAYARWGRVTDVP